MDKLTDWNDTTDVSDAAIEWVIAALAQDRSPASIRRWANMGDGEERAMLIAARLVEQHRPDLLVDPVDAIAREEAAKAYEDGGDYATAARIRAGTARHVESVAKRLYLMGLEAGKNS